MPARHRARAPPAGVGGVAPVNAAASQHAVGLGMSVIALTHLPAAKEQIVGGETRSPPYLTTGRGAIKPSSCCRRKGGGPQNRPSSPERLDGW
eukprot:6898822-Prymnesium_polylepis.2